jgi:hypothetical protein
MAHELDGKRTPRSRRTARVRAWRRVTAVGLLGVALAGGATIAVGHAREGIRVDRRAQGASIGQVHNALPTRSRKETGTEATPTAVEATPTTIVIYHPWMRDGVLVSRLNAVGTVNGQCPLRALDDSRAWRCFGATNNRVYDSCFTSPIDASLLACIEAPWKREADLLRVPSPLPQNPPEDSDVNTQGVVWALELTDGRRCGFISGATAAFGDLRLNYVCPDGTSLWGEPNRSRAVWTILASPSGTNYEDEPAFHANPRLFAVAVKTAWF